MKNYIQKILNITLIFFNSLNSTVMAEFPTSNLYSGVEVRFIYLFDRPFLVLMKITLQFNYCNLRLWWCSKSPIWSSSFIASFHHFSYKERPDLQKTNLFTLIQYFSQKIPWSTVFFFPAPLKSKAVQGSQFCKANIPRVTQCHRTQTLHEIESLWFIRLGY